MFFLFFSCMLCKQPSMPISKKGKWSETKRNWLRNDLRPLEKACACRSPRLTVRPCFFCRQCTFQKVTICKCRSHFDPIFIVKKGKLFGSVTKLLLGGLNNNVSPLATSRGGSSLSFKFVPLRVSEGTRSLNTDEFRIRTHPSVRFFETAIYWKWWFFSSFVRFVLFWSTDLNVRFFSRVVLRKG